MLALLRFLLLASCAALVLAFFAAIGMAWLFAHPEVTTRSVTSHIHHLNPFRK